MMYDELSVFNLFDRVRKVDVPVYFLCGRHDKRVSPELAWQYYESLEAPFKRFIWFEQSAHLIIYEEPEKFNAIMEDEVLGETAAASVDGQR